MSAGVLETLEAAFLPHSIRLHFDYDPFALIPHAEYVRFFADDSCDLVFGFGASFYEDLKQAPYWDEKLKYVYHFAVVGHSWCVDSQTSGIAEISGNDILLTLGDAPFNFFGEHRKFFEAGSLMYELGHNFGLRHLVNSAGIPTPRAPNFLSVMNLRYQFVGIFTADQPITNSPTTSSGIRRLDYSSSVLPTLDENHLDETFVLQPGSTDALTYNCPGGSGCKGWVGGPIDWNCDGDDTDVAVNIDGQLWFNLESGSFEPILDVLECREEWSTLQYAFQCSQYFEN